MNWIVGPQMHAQSLLCHFRLCIVGRCCSDSCYCAQCGKRCMELNNCPLYCFRGPDDPIL